jgi:hypothetical protein
MLENDAESSNLFESTSVVKIVSVGRMHHRLMGRASDGENLFWKIDEPLGRSSIPP